MGLKLKIKRPAPKPAAHDPIALSTSVSHISAPPTAAEPAPSGSGASHSTSQNAPPTAQAPRRLLKIKRSTTGSSLAAAPAHVAGLQTTPPPAQPLQPHTPDKTRKLKLRKISHPNSNRKLSNGSRPSSALLAPPNSAPAPQGPKKLTLKRSNHSAAAAPSLPNYNRINLLINASSMLNSSLSPAPGAKAPLKLKGHPPGTKVSLKLRAPAPLSRPPLNQGPTTVLPTTTAPPRKILKIKRHSLHPREPSVALKWSSAAVPPSDQPLPPRKPRLGPANKGVLGTKGPRKSLVGRKRSAAFANVGQPDAALSRSQVLLCISFPFFSRYPVVVEC
jgi:hypothetical protein